MTEKTKPTTPTSQDCKLPDELELPEGSMVRAIQRIFGAARQSLAERKRRASASALSAGDQIPVEIRTRRRVAAAWEARTIRRRKDLA
jgi:hypothetical protein